MPAPPSQIGRRWAAAAAAAAPYFLRDGGSPNRHALRPGTHQTFHCNSKKLQRVSVAAFLGNCQSPVHQYGCRHTPPAPAGEARHHLRCMHACNAAGGSDGGTRTPRPGQLQSHLAAAFSSELEVYQQVFLCCFTA
jgi:hypothetical protein